MTVEHVLAFNLALIAAWASPGPAMLVALRATLAGGRVAGMATGAGLALVAALWTLAALAGLEGAFRLFPWAYAALKLAGALYLLHIAWSTWRHAARPVGQGGPPGRRAFLDGVLVNLANPKSVLFAAAVLVVIFPPGLGWPEKAAIALNHVGVELVAYGGLAAAVGSRAVAARYLRAKAVLDRGAAVVLGALGLRLLLDR